MSELIAEARVLVTPDTTTFRALLTSQLASATKGVTVPVNVVPVTSGATGAAGLLGEEKKLTEQIEKEKVALEAASDEKVRAGESARQYQRRLSGVSSGAASAALSLVGLRGATLAASAPFLAGAAAAIVFAKSVGLASEFAKQLSVLQATSGATVDELRRVSETAKQLGADITLPGVSAIDAAQAMTELSKAGLTVQESIDGARGVLQLATAAAISNAEATELAANALNSFGLAGDQAVHVADVLANASNDAQGSITDIGLALQQSSAAGRQAGLSLEETAGILTIFARNGIRGSDAGTLLRTMLLRLINPSKQASEIINDLGLNLRDATGDVNLGFFDEFARKTRSLTNAERDRAAAVIAGQDAFRGLSILQREGGVALNEQISRLDRSGTAAELAAARTQGLAGATENLKNQLTNAGLAIGESLTPALTDLVSAAGTAIGTVTDLATEIGKLREQASKPIELAFDLIPGGGGEGRLSGFIDDFFSTLPGQVAGATDSFRDLVDIVRESEAQFQAVSAQKALPQLIADLNKTGASATAFDELVTKLKGMEVQMRGGAAETETFRKKFVLFIEELQKLSQQPDIEVPITLPPGLFDGSVGADAAKATAKGFADEIRGSDFGFQGMIRSIRAQGLAGFAEAGKAAGTAFAEAASASAASQLDLDLAVAQAGGDEGAELSVLRTKEENQARFLENLLKRPQTEKNVKWAEDAAKNLARTRDAIAAILRGQEADAKAEANEIEQRASAADAAVLGALSSARTRQENAIAQAAQTEGARDDIRETIQLRDLIKRQIQAIRDRVGDEKTKKAAIEALTTALIATIGSIKKLRDTAREEREQAAQERRDQLEENLELRTQIAEARGNESAVLKRLNAQIAFQRKEVAAAKNLNDRLTEQLKLEQLLRKKRELIAEERQEGTTAFSLLTQAAARFTGGNIIGAAQPFAGPTEFTADLSQFLRRNATTSTAPTATKSPFAGFTGSADRLVEAINRNTAALNGGEEGPPVRKGKRPPVSKAVGNTFRGWWQFADEARDQVEGAG